MSPDESSTHAGTMRVGTSGWSYGHWRDGVFYPAGMHENEWLRYYATRFRTVEINATFYRMPTQHAVELWRDEVPDDFIFAVKGSRYITHIKRLKDVAEAVGTFMERVGHLRHKLGLVLWQLPPQSKRDDERLARFLELLPGRIPGRAREGGQGPLRHAVEFRDESWYDGRVLGILRDAGAALVNASGDRLPPKMEPTADFVYARFHGTRRYHGEYAEPALEPWVSYFASQMTQGRDIWAYFNNDAQGHAPRDAVRLERMLYGVRSSGGSR